MSELYFSEDAWEEYLYWQEQDKKTLFSGTYYVIGSIVKK